jgi:YggT family protein
MARVEDPEPVAREERAKIHHLDGYERQTHIVEDLNADRRLFASRLAQIVWLLFGVLEALIGLRIILKLIAANPSNPFANLVYSFTDLFLWPFSGITVAPSFNGMVFEIPAIIALLVYAMVGWLLTRLVWLLFYSPASRTVKTIEKEHDHLRDL